jgi:hypothetical protein
VADLLHCTIGYMGKAAAGFKEKLCSATKNFPTSAKRGSLARRRVATADWVGAPAQTS